MLTRSARRSLVFLTVSLRANRATPASTISRLSNVLPAESLQLSAECSAGIPPFALRTSDVLVVERLVRFVQPADEEAVLDAYINTNNLSADPYWATLWPSAVAAAQAIFLEPRLFASKQVLDLGCGVGLAGAAAGLAGASSVLLADLSPWALHCALATCSSNGLRTLSNSLPNVSATEAPGQGVCRTIQLDWAAPPPAFASAFDVILACDVLYASKAATPIAQLVLSSLKNGGLLLLADPPLRTPKNRGFLLALLAEGGATVVQTTELLIDFNERSVPIMLHMIRMP